jgi:hypothetical protein
MERSRLRRLEDVEKDLLEMKLQIWRQRAVDREEWVSVIEGHEAVREP